MWALRKSKGSFIEGSPKTLSLQSLASTFLVRLSLKRMEEQVEITAMKNMMMRRKLAKEKRAKPRMKMAMEKKRKRTKMKIKKGLTR
jgi:competence transcription factor ComK